MLNSDNIEIVVTKLTVHGTKVRLLGFLKSVFFQFYKGSFEFYAVENGWCGRGGSADLCIQALLCRTAGAERTKRYSGRVTCSDREKRTPSNKSGGYFYDEDRSDRTGCCEH